MATATPTTKNNPAAEIPEIAQKIREQLLSTVQRGQQLVRRGCPGIGHGHLGDPPSRTCPRSPAPPLFPPWKPRPRSPSMSPRICSV